jgi:hypothetical protein
LFTWNARKGEPDAPQPTSASRITETLSASRALPKLLSALAVHPAPILLDLGPVVGTNVSFFGERLACRIVIEDLREDVEAWARGGGTDDLAEMVTSRVLAAVSEPVHGVLCWDVFDCLDRTASRSLAACLTGILAPKGVLHGLFGTEAGSLDSRTKFIVQSETSLKCRREPATEVRRHALQTGEITRLFSGLSTIESVLLQNHTREVLLRKS